MSWTHYDYLDTIDSVAVGKPLPEGAPTLADALDYVRSLAPVDANPDDDSVIARAQRKLLAKRRQAGLDPATGMPLQAPIVGARANEGTVPSATNGILALVKAAEAGEVRLDPGKAPKTDPEA